MKVLMTADAVGGVWTYALELAGALEPHGVEVALATMGPPPSPAQREQLERSPVAAVHVSSFDLEWIEVPWDDVERAGLWLLEIVRELEPDVVHLNGFAHGALDWPAPVLVAGHSCVLSWWHAVKGEPAPPRLARYADAVRRGLDGPDLLVTPTRALLAELERHYDPRCERLVIPNGRTPLTPRAKEPFVLASGRAWDAAKNLEALDRAAPELPWPVIVAGPGGDGEFVHARALGALEREELDGLVSRASIFAAPARYEPFGLGALEAATTGCALVLGDIPSLREVWDDAAWFVDPDDDAALAEALARLVADDRARTRLAAAARARSRLYTPGRMASGYVGAYRKLVRSTRPLEAVT